MTPVETASVAAGVVLFVGGFSLLSIARRLDSGPRFWPVVGRVSRATETASGLALVFAGYHVVAYGGPAGWLTFRVPPDLAWLVFLACALAVVGTLVTDRFLGEPAEDEGGERGA